jgi:hypothetical protein
VESSDGLSANLADVHPNTPTALKHFLGNSDNCPESMKVAAHEAPLVEGSPAESIQLIRGRLSVANWRAYHFFAARKQFSAASRTTTMIPGSLRSGSTMGNSIVGFTELASDNHLYNAGAVFHL